MVVGPSVKFQVVSDCHMEQGGTFTEFEIPPVQGARFLILAGDIYNCANRSRQKRYRQWLLEQIETFEKVFLVFGNNDVKGTTVDLAEAWAHELEFEPQFKDRFYYLEKNRVNLQELNVVILGTTLWSNITTKFGKLVDGDRNIKRNSVEAHRERYADSLEYLKEGVANIKHKDPTTRIVIITHHAPTLVGSNHPGREGDAPYPYDNWSTFQTDILGGEGIELLGAGDAWVHGHTHWTHKTYQDEVQVFANQVGRHRRNFDHGNLLVI